MASITTVPFARHLRSTATMHVHHLARGRVRHSAPGASFWFRPLTAAVSEVPVDDREQPVLVQLRTADLHQVAVPAVVTYRFADPVLAASRIDFSIDLLRGTWTQTPLEAAGAVLHGATTAATASALGGEDLRAVLLADLSALGSAVRGALRGDERLGAVGIEVVGVRFSLVRPEPDVERALQTPAREAIQTEADRATYERRAVAVEREAAIGENELANQIELSRRREQLIAQDGANDRRQAQEAAAAGSVATHAEAARITALAAARAQAQRATGAAAAESERAKVAAYADASPEVLLALAVREAAANLPKIDQLVLTPDLLAGVLGQLTGAPRRS